MILLDNPPVLGESRSTAVQRYVSVERSLRKKGMWEPYKEAVNDFIEKGHAEIVPAEDLKKPIEQVFYMPMHAVYKSSSSSTKIRPVCDASAASSTGVSYNDMLSAGPSLYPSLPSILIKFRDAPIAMSADVAKMYRQILLHPKDRDYHRFLFSPDDKRLVDFRMNTVTFGVKSSPYVASRILLQMAQDLKEQFPHATTTVETSFYMDDVLTGAESVTEALQLRQDLNAILAHGGMKLCKWRSNNNELLDSIPEELRETSDLQILASPADVQKALGVHWSSQVDDLHISTPSDQPASTVTKRQLVSVMARVFDPLGWFSPAIMTLRMIVQEAWTLKVGWDKELPQAIFLVWTGWLQEMPLLTDFPIHRPYRQLGKRAKSREIHGFCDASEGGFGGVVYLRSLYEDNTITMDLIVAKGRVAPLKALTIPRLELQGAVVLAHLLHQVSEDLSISLHNQFGWTDAMIVLGWLKHTPSSLAVFVGNRILKIQTVVPAVQWRHVPSRDNPADCLSRGLRPRDNCTHKLWWDGPDWLKQPPEMWPQTPDSSTVSLPELRPSVSIVQPEVDELGADQTSLSHWIRLVAWVRRFWRNLTINSTNEKKLTEPFLSSQELTQAKETILRSSQKKTMPEEYAMMNAGKVLHKHHRLARLSPYMDPADGLIKSQTRLQQSDLPSTTTNPIILHRKSNTVLLLVDFMHRHMMHPPLSATLATLAFSYVIPQVRPILKTLIAKCMVCQRKWAHPVRQRIGDLPAFRCTQTQVFAAVGIDYAGPVYITQGRGKAYQHIKTYIAVFVCMSSRAVHLELAADATTKTFLAALDRFCGRRGTPSHIRSDNGGNFVGAARELKETLSELRQDEAKRKIHLWSADKGVQWHFSPALSPKHGGLWEAGVKTLKKLIRRTLYQLTLTMDELNTIVISAEGIMNSRPYLPILSTDPNGLCPLTPGHLLIGCPISALPQRVDVRSKLQNIRHWDLVKRMQHQHWCRFRKEYLPQLAARAKPMVAQKNIEINDVVLMSDKSNKRLHWPLGRVTATYPGPDGLVRVVDVQVETSRTADNKTSATIYRRDVSDLVKMPVHIPDR